MSLSVRCDGDPDCPDRSDEDGCVSPVECPDDQTRCLNTQECVLQEWICDGDGDCRDMSDEQVTLSQVFSLSRVDLHVCPELTSCVCVEL